MFGRTSVFDVSQPSPNGPLAPSAGRLYQEALLTATTNPKPILFFTAHFPQFISEQAPLLSQFFILTGIFLTLSFTTLMSYALLASGARKWMSRPRLSKWINRSFGAIFIGFGAVLLTLRRQAS